MVFKRLMASLGSGGAKVDTVLSNPSVYPGGTLQGTVNLMGGSVDQHINHVAVAIRARVEVESGDYEHVENIDIHKLPLAGQFVLGKNQRQQIPFQLPVPWEMPLTAISGQHLRGMAIGVATELDIANAVDSTDIDAIQVNALPTQQLMLDAILGLGFFFKSADIEKGYIRGTQQQLPYYQEIEFGPSPQWMGRVNELECSFIANPQFCEVVFEVDKRSFMGSTDVYHKLVMQNATAAQTDWRQELNNVLMRLVGGGMKGGW